VPPSATWESTATTRSRLPVFLQADLGGEIADTLRDNNVQRAAIGTLYVVGNAARFLAPAVGVAADFIPVAGQLILAYQIGHALWNGGKAYKESVDQCYERPWRPGCFPSWIPICDQNQWTPNPNPSPMPSVSGERNKVVIVLNVCGHFCPSGWRTLAALPQGCFPRQFRQASHGIGYLPGVALVFDAIQKLDENRNVLRKSSRCLCYGAMLPLSKNP
jgi:hypothetical protein